MNEQPELTNNRPMTRLLVGAAVALLVAPLVAEPPAPPLRVFIRAGVKTHNPVDNGIHDYPAFLAEWSKILLERGARVDGALHFPTAEELARTDVLVIYKGDGGTCRPAERRILERYLHDGGGLVVLHDGMCSDDPAWFAPLAGGAKQHGEMNYSPASSSSTSSIGSTRSCAAPRTSRSTTRPFSTCGRLRACTSSSRRRSP